MRAPGHVAALLALVTLACTLDLGPFRPIGPLEETRVLGEEGPKLLLIELEGVIGAGDRRGPLGTVRPSRAARLREALERAAQDEDIAGLLLRINSPGGSVAATETLHHQILRWKRENDRPVVAFLNGLAASGGYYVAMAADEVVAHPTTVTGSIGVIMTGINVAGLMERFGIQDQTLKSGAFKDAGSPLRPMRPDEREQLQSVIDDLHLRFVEVVTAGRPALGRDAVAALADGRIFTATQALDAGLIDRIGHLEDAIEAAERLAGIAASRVVSYHRPSEYRDNIYSRTPGPPIQIVDIDVPGFPGAALPVGFHYLWPPAAGAR